MNIETQAFIAAQVARGALFVLNHSGGKDSQVQQIVMEGLVPHSQLLVVHADLGEVEWDGCEDHIRATMTGDVELIVCRAGKTFFDMVEHRQMFPSPSNRQCTSDLKRDPISKAIRHYLKAHPEFGGLVINCMGLRAQESASRSKLTAIKLNARNSVAGREWYDVLPIHDMSERSVFATIKGAGQKPHWVYAQGMSRKSCCFCIMACDADLKRASELRPELARKYAETERRINFTVSMRGRPLSEIVGRDLLAAAK
jgi:DNA sulfur modification protein DndC